MPYKRVEDAVLRQLKIEAKPAQDLTFKMGKDLGYDYYTVQLFLVSVERLIAHGTPSYKFSWKDEFAMDALRFSIEDLVGAINDRTV